jgi:hypothetical protein
MSIDDNHPTTNFSDDIFADTSMQDFALNDALTPTELVGFQHLNLDLYSENEMVELPAAFDLDFLLAPCDKNGPCAASLLAKELR